MTIEEYKQHCILQANWWMVYANTNNNLNRIVTDGNGRQFTKEELVDDAMNTSRNHIHNYWEACNKNE